MKGSESFLSGRFNDPYGRPGDSIRIRETPGNPGELACMLSAETVTSRESKWENMR